MMLHSKLGRCTRCMIGAALGLTMFAALAASVSVRAPWNVLSLALAAAFGALLTAHLIGFVSRRLFGDSHRSRPCAGCGWAGS